MAATSVKLTFAIGEFVALIGAIPIALLTSRARELALSVPLTDVFITPQRLAVVFEFSDFPTAADRLALANLVATFTGGSTTSQPFEYNSFGVSTSTSSTPVTKLDNTTPPLDAGTYQVLWTTSLRMQAVIANTGVEATIRLVTAYARSLGPDTSLLR